MIDGWRHMWPIWKLHEDEGPGDQARPFVFCAVFATGAARRTQRLVLTNFLHKHTLRAYERDYFQSEWSESHA